MVTHNVATSKWS